MVTSQKRTNAQSKRHLPACLIAKKCTDDFVAPIVFCVLLMVFILRERMCWTQLFHEQNIKVVAAQVSFVESTHKNSVLLCEFSYVAKLIMIFLVVCITADDYCNGGFSDLISLNTVKLTTAMGFNVVSKLGICHWLQNNGSGFLN